MQEKLAVTVLVITLALFGLAVKLYMLVDEKNEEYTEIVLNQQSSYNSRTLPYRRGDIVDRNGTYLATSEKVYNLILDPNQINKDSANYLETTVTALVDAVSYTHLDVYKRQGLDPGHQVGGVLGAGEASAGNVAGDLRDPGSSGFYEGLQGVVAVCAGGAAHDFCIHRASEHFSRTL